MKEFFKDLMFFTGCLFAAAFLLGMIKGYMDMPEVHFSHSTGKAVKVQYEGVSIENPKPEQIPKQYHVVWVK